jgi:hypothetical protein
MGDILNAIKGTPIPTIIVIGGIALLFLGLVGGISGKIQVPRERQKLAAIIGGVLIAIGIILHLVSGSAPSSEDAGVPSGTSPPEDLELGSDPTVLLEEAREWSLIFQDRFDTNATGWEVGDGPESDLARDHREVSNGQYIWEMEGFDDEVWGWYTPPIDPIDDFYFSVKVEHIENAGSGAAYGVVFRREGRNFYTFRITDNQDFRVRRRYEDGWIDLIGWTQSASVRPGDVNRLTVIGQGGDFRFYINDHFVGEARDELLSRGNVGVTIALANAGDADTFAFDDFEVRGAP